MSKYGTYEVRLHLTLDEEHRTSPDKWDWSQLISSDGVRLLLRHAKVRRLTYDGSDIRALQEAAGEFVAVRTLNPHWKERKMTQTDFEVNRYGTLFLVCAESSEALEHLEDTVEDNAQWFNTYTLVVEQHYIDSLVEKLRADGYTVDIGAE